MNIQQQPLIRRNHDQDDDVNPKSSSQRPRKGSNGTGEFDRRGRMKNDWTMTSNKKGERRRLYAAWAEDERYYTKYVIDTAAATNEAYMFLKATAIFFFRKFQVDSHASDAWNKKKLKSGSAYKVGCENRAILSKITFCHRRR